ncbi:MAG: glycosyltransferase [Rhodococcus sp. (in: high G+C Gram-positive bacteria)]|nr:glycosyltransferase [Rhodococcus sp. (in: high G+C Gram-positive bacteria)]MDI6628290.1 glycosyltransferase [Rhodococcus sp. (in: high G+C Gram-positive bacteria)]
MPISLVSIVLPVYNGLPDLDEQLEAIAGQDYTGDVELIISDNGSTDGLRAHLEELSASVDA